MYAPQNNAEDFGRERNFSVAKSIRRLCGLLFHCMDGTCTVLILCCIIMRIIKVIVL